MLLVLGVLWIIAPVWSPGYPWGSDSWGHLHRANYMLEAIQQHGWVDGFFKSAWMTDWYMGDPTRVYYPPLMAWVLGGLSGLTGDVFVAYRLFVSIALGFLAFSVYIIGLHWNQNQNRWAAMAGALMAVMAPYTLRTIFSEGNLPRALVILTLPWIIWWSEYVLIRKRVGLQVILLSALWAVALIAHVMQAAMFAVIVAGFIIARALVNVYIPLRRIPLALLPIGVGGVLAAFYLLPAYSHLELANVPYLPASKIDLFSIDFGALTIVQGELESVHIGSLALIVAAVLSLLSRMPLQRVLLSMAFVSIVLAFGNASGIYRVVPLYQMMLPERFLNAAVILIPLSVASLPQMNRRRYIMLGVGLLLVWVVEFMPASRMIHMRPEPVDEQAVGTALVSSMLPGRIASLTQPGPTSPQIYLTSEISGNDHISGWGLENTPHQDAIRRLLAATTRSPAYVERMLSLWSSDYLLTRPGEPQDVADFYRIATTPSLIAWQRDSASSFTQRLPDNRMLIIGQNATSWLFAFPFASEGYAADPAAYDREYLDQYRVIGLNRFTGATDNLEDWVADGNTLVADLSGYDPIFSQGYSLFGVQSLPLALGEPVTIQWSDDFEDMPQTFPTGELPWIGATYRGLDEVIASINYHGVDYPLIGRQAVGAGDVWYIGFNLLYWLDITGQQDAIAQIRDIILQGSGVNRSLSLPPLPVEDLNIEADRVTFSTTTMEPINAILSMTYFPRWTVAVNGEPAQIFNHEHLLGIKLSAGQNEVVLHYRPYSGVSLAGAAVSLIGLVGVVAIGYRLQQKPILALEDREGHFYDRHASHAMPPLPEETGLTECPVCGCQEAVIGPPTEDSYPFVSVTCPKCGYTL